jgi:hypothetical protein
VGGASPRYRVARSGGFVHPALYRRPVDPLEQRLERERFCVVAARLVAVVQSRRHVLARLVAKREQRVGIDAAVVRQFRQPRKPVPVAVRQQPNLLGCPRQSVRNDAVAIVLGVLLGLLRSPLGLVFQMLSNGLSDLFRCRIGSPPPTTRRDREGHEDGHEDGHEQPLGSAGLADGRVIVVPRGQEVGLPRRAAVGGAAVQAVVLVHDPRHAGPSLPSL